MPPIRMLTMVLKLSAVDFSEENVLRHLGMLSRKHSAGPDGVPQFFLYMIRFGLAKPLVHSLSNIFRPLPVSILMENFKSHSNF